MTDFDLSFIPALYQPTSLLPIARHKESLLYAIETNQVTILVGQTGSGKTTQLPQFLDQAGWTTGGKTIAVTQPRRVAVTTVATRVAEEMRCDVGEAVGYSIRFEDVTSAKTRIKFLTDGMLLREALVDPLLSRYSVIMVDEAHERSLSSDVLLGLLKKIKKRRPELRIIVSSATIEAEQFASFFQDDEGEGTPRIVSIEGRTYPVDILYLDQPTDDYVDKAVQTVFTIHQQESPGDILVFLTGREEIETAVSKLSDLAATLPLAAPALQPLPLYAGLTTDEQMYVFSAAAENTRKVILSTNIAEASVTIAGILYVVDSGFVKLRAYSPATNIETLTPFPISRASATQRAGRAGRTQPGKCFRLYTQAAHQALPATTPPEIQRSNLAPLVLQLKALGIDNVVRFPFVSPPPAALVVRALDQLFALGALDTHAKLTAPLGTRMAELALPPMLSRALLAAAHPARDVLPEMLSVAAMLALQGGGGGGGVWVGATQDSARRAFAATQGDHLTLLNVYTAFAAGPRRRDATWCRAHGLSFKALERAVRIRAQLARALERAGVGLSSSSSSSSSSTTSRRAPEHKSESILRCLAAGYFANAARMQADGSFTSLGGQVTMHAHPTSLMFNRKADYVIFSEVLETASKIFIRDVSQVEKSWLLDEGGGYYSVKE